MLVLARLEKESIVVDLRPFNLGLLEVVVVSVRGKNVRIGITANDHIYVDRSEVYEAKERERLEERNTSA